MDDLEFEEEGKSKTQIKKDMLALQELGEAIANLSQNEIEKLPLDGKLRDAILESEQIKKHGARRRHFQYIGKLMRKSNHEEIAEAYEHLQIQQKSAARKFHLVEEWRDRLISGEDLDLKRFFESYPHCERQQLMQLIRNCQKERDLNKNLGANKKLFRFLREQIIENI